MISTQIDLLLTFESETLESRSKAQQTWIFL